jgi:hypothetical protein
LQAWYQHERGVDGGLKSSHYLSINELEGHQSFGVECRGMGKLHRGKSNSIVTATFIDREVEKGEENASVSSA